MCYLLEVCFPSQLADDRAGGIVSHVHLLDGHRLGQRVAPDAEDPSNPQVQSWYVDPRLRPQGKRVRGGMSWERELERGKVGLFLPFLPSFLLLSIFPPFSIPSFPPPVPSALPPSFLPFLISFSPHLTFPLSSPPPALSVSAPMWGGGRRICRNSSCCSSRGGRLIDRRCGGGATCWKRRGWRVQSLGWKRQKEMSMFFYWCRITRYIKSFNLMYLVVFYLLEKTPKSFDLIKLLLN